MDEFTAVGYRVRFVGDDILGRSWIFHEGKPPAVVDEAIEIDVLYTKNFVAPNETSLRVVEEEPSPPRQIVPDGIAKATKEFTDHATTRAFFSGGTFDFQIHRTATFKRCFNCNEHPVRVRVILIKPGGRRHKREKLWICPACSETRRG